MSHNSTTSPDTIGSGSYQQSVQQVQARAGRIQEMQRDTATAPALQKPTVVGSIPVFDGITGVRQN